MTPDDTVVPSLKTVVAASACCFLCLNLLWTGLFLCSGKPVLVLGVGALGGLGADGFLSRTSATNGNGDGPGAAAAR